MIENWSLRSGSYGKKGEMNLRDIINSNLRSLVNTLEWDKSRVTCQGIKETPTHVPRQLKDGPLTRTNIGDMGKTRPRSWRLNHVR